VLPFLAVPRAAQVGAPDPLAGAPPAGGGPAATASYTSIGTGCASRGRSYGADVVLPAALATEFGNGANNMPFSWQASRYQQVFLGSETGSGANVIGLGFRQDETHEFRDTHKVELEVFLGGTTFTPQTITGTFDANFDSTANPKTLVFSRRHYALPRMPALPRDPAQPLFTLPLDAPWPMNLGTNNLLLEIKQLGTSNNNVVWNYPLDAHAGATTSRVYASGFPNQATGIVNAGYGLVVHLRTAGTAVPPRPTIHNANRPVIGRDFHFQLLGFAGNTTGVVAVGASRLNVDLTPFGAPGCTLLTTPGVAAVVSLARGGDVAMTISVPNDAALDGQNLYMQSAALDATHPLGFTFSNGGQLTVGLN
jgi:hypothetical protein